MYDQTKFCFLWRRATLRTRVAAPSGFWNWSFDPEQVEENVAVTKDGVDMLTAYLKELRSL